MIYRFEDFELDTSNFELIRNGEKLALEPKVYDLLSYLVSSQKKLVTKEELFEHLWPGQIVTEASLSNQIKEARKALGDSGKRQAFIKTVHGRGFQFLSQTRTLQQQLSSCCETLAPRSWCCPSRT